MPLLWALRVLDPAAGGGIAQGPPDTDPVKLKREGCKMKKLPRAILEMASRKLECGEIGLLQTHPNYDGQRESEVKAYKIMEAKLTHEELLAVEGAWAGELIIHFEVAYAAGVMDGAKTMGALAEAEGAATR